MMLGRRTFLLVSVIALLGFLATPLLPSKKEPEIRKVKGLVIDAEDTPISGAIVYLKNLKTKRNLSVTTGDDGSFLFPDIDRKADCEIHAEYKGASSSIRTLTSLDPRLTIMLNLKIVTQK